MWTVSDKSIQAIKHRCFTSSGGDFLADLTLRVAPDLDRPEVTFKSDAKDSTAKEYVPYVEQGVRQFVTQRAEENQPVGYLQVTLIEISVQLVDAKGYRFSEAAMMGLDRAFEAGSVRLE